jgi:hypothetical protein
VRPVLAWVTASCLLALWLGGTSPTEVARRTRFLRHYAAESLETRRLAGAAAAFDRDYFVFLEAVRRQLPSGTPGVALRSIEPSNRAYYLAVYWLAPTPALPPAAPVPPGWVAAVYGPDRPPGWRVIAPVHHGALLGPPP